MRLSMIEKLIIATIIFILFLIVFVTYKESKQWQEFSQAHNCKKVSYIKGSSNVGYGTSIMPNGQVGVGTVIINNPDKTGYLCDDGITYWR